MTNLTLSVFRILLITPVSPFSLASGAEQRSALMYQALAKLGRVDVIHLIPGGTTDIVCDQTSDRVLLNATLKKRDLSLSRYRPDADFTKKIEAALRTSLSSYNIIVGRYIWPICQLNIPSQVPIIVDLDDFNYRYSYFSLLSSHVLVERIKKFFAERMSRRQFYRFSAVFFAALRDQAELPAIQSAILPNVPLHICANPQFTSYGKDILFVGSLWYRPNTEGINWFLDAVWPQVLNAYPEARLTLVGAAPRRLRAQWERFPQVFAVGFAEDLAAAYSSSSLVIVPIHSGGGTNVKLLEALGNGRPCITTRFTYAAFADQLEASKHLFVADNASDFAEQCIQVLAKPGNAMVVARNGYDAVKQYYTSDRFERIVADFVSKVVA